MKRRISVLVAVLAALLLLVPAATDLSIAEAKPDKRRVSKGKRSASKAKSARKRSARKRARRRGRKRSFSGRAATQTQLRSEPLTKPSGDIWLYAENFREEIKLNIYDERGRINDASLAELDHGFRCKRTKEERAVDPRLYETLSRIYDHFGKKRIILVSGFRFQRNEGSRHYHASAMDIRIQGVSSRELYKYAESLDPGNMGIGIYPRSGFVHIDMRAPGDPSYRWTDRSPPNSRNRGKNPSRKWKRRSKRPNS